MRRNVMLFAAVMLCSISAPAFAKLDVRTTRIAHGVEAWYVENDTVPVVDVMLTIEGAGTTSDPDGKSGRANFAAAMLTEGAGELDANAFAQALEERTITLSMSASADRLTIHIHCLRADAVRAGELLALALTRPNLSEPDMALVRSQMLAVLKQLEESPDYQASKLLASRAFKGHPYANPSYGTAASVASFNAQDVREYLGQLTRGNVILSASGDVDSSLLNDMLRPTIEALKDGTNGAALVPAITMQGGGETLHQVSNLPQTVIAFAAPGLPRNDPRFYAAYLLNHILGGNPLTARLGDEIRQKKGLAYNVGTGLEARRNTHLLSGNLSTRNSTAEAALAAVKAVIADVREKGVTTEQCNDARSFVLGNFPLQLDRSTAVTGLLYNMQVNQLGPYYMNDRVAKFNAVSCGDINAIARELLAPERFLFAVVGGTGDANAPAAPPATPTHGDAR